MPSTSKIRRADRGKNFINLYIVVSLADKAAFLLKHAPRAAREALRDFACAFGAPDFEAPDFEARAVETRDVESQELLLQAHTTYPCRRGTRDPQSGGGDG